MQGRVPAVVGVVTSKPRGHAASFGSGARLVGTDIIAVNALKQ